jgi:hypothetical protein
MYNPWDGFTNQDSFQSFDQAAQVQTMPISPSHDMNTVIASLNNITIQLNLLNSRFNDLEERINHFENHNIEVTMNAAIQSELEQLNTAINEKVDEVQNMTTESANAVKQKAISFINKEVIGMRNDFRTEIATVTNDAVAYLKNEFSKMKSELQASDNLIRPQFAPNKQIKLKIKSPDTYSGERSADQIESWIFQIESWVQSQIKMQNIQCSDTEMHDSCFITGKMLLKGETLMFWRTCCDEVNKGLRKCSTWKEFKDLIRKNYYPADNDALVRLKLGQHKQSRKGILDYTNTFRSLMLQLPRASNEELYSFFKQGLKENVRLHLVSRASIYREIHNTDLPIHQAIKYAEEYSENLSGPSVNDSNHSTDVQPMDLSHISSKQKLNNVQISRSQLKLLRKLEKKKSYKSKNDSSKNQNDGKARCYECGSTKHFASYHKKSKMINTITQTAVDKESDDEEKSHHNDSATNSDGTESVFSESEEISSNSESD